MRKLLTAIVLLLALPAVAGTEESAAAQPATAQVSIPHAEAQLAAEIFDGGAVQPLAPFGVCRYTCTRCVIGAVPNGCPPDPWGRPQSCLSMCP